MSTKYSIVIPTHSNFKHLVECIEYVKNNSKDYEIIVVDNASIDGTKKYLEDDKDIITIYNDKNLGFGKAVNKGIRKSIGQWIAVLNDDALVPKDWLKKFETDCKVYEQMSGTKQASIAAPLSNFVGMRIQQVKNSGRNLFEEEAKQIYAQNYRKVVPTGIVSGLCMFVNRKVFDKIGYFDERFFAGCEDLDFCVRAYEAGFITIVCNDIYVWHYGSQTIDRFPELQRGTAHIIELLEKYAGRKTSKQKLGVIYRTKIRDDYEADVFIRSLKKSSQFADHIFILDDNSVHNMHIESTDKGEATLNIMSPEGSEDIDRSVYIPCEFTLRHHSRNFDERRDRNELLKMAKDAGMDWVFSIDADEIVEDKVDRKYIERLINTPDPAAHGYSVHYYTFWNDEKHYNSGDVWKNMCGNRLVRLTDDPKIFLGAKSTFHVGNIPFVPQDFSRHSSIRIKHYGYVHPEQRQRKYEWYEKMDFDKNPALIGHPDYKHLINENPVLLRNWIEDATISLCTIMKNEQQSLLDFLRSYTPFVDETVIVDTGSTDKSVWMAELFGCKVIHEPWNDSFSDVRNTACRNATSTWILHLDIDERLDDLVTLRRMMDTNFNGFMFYVNNLMKENRYSLSETVRLFRRSSGFKYTGYVHETIERNGNVNIGRAPMKVFHFGYLKSQEELTAKMRKYFEINKRQIKDFPQDPRPRYAIAIHYLEEGFLDKAEENLIKAGELDNNFYQCHKDLAYLYLAKAQKYFDKVTHVLPQDHPFHNMCTENSNGIREMVGAQSQVAKGHLNGLV